MSLPTKIGNRKKDILILDKGPTKALEHTLSVEKMYSINFSENNKTFCWACVIMEQIVIYLLKVQMNLKQKILRL